MEERRMGNDDFRKAEKTTREAIIRMQLPEADYFMKEFLPAYQLTLDEQA